MWFGPEQVSVVHNSNLYGEKVIIRYTTDKNYKYSRDINYKMIN